jgi:glycosidase
MRKLFYTYAAIALLAGACTTAEGDRMVSRKKPLVQTSVFPEKAKDMTIYEVNIRQHTPEGTFKAFQEHLPRLKELGADILWIMPIQPIGEKNRKETLGSYYSIRDYKAVNPEFGTLDDFKALVNEAHKQGFLVILDWVPNHTAWDHSWIETNPEYYMSDSAARVVGKRLGVGADYYQQSGTGNLVYEADWSDIALLNLYNDDTRRAMIDAMRFWIEDTDIDGFRADHAGHEIPLFFWEEATDELNKLKDLFWLAEWDEPRMHLTFHASYDWKLMHLTEAVAKGEKNADNLHEHIYHDRARYGQKAFRLNMITNHDENAWAGTINERYGKGADAMAVFSFTAYGTPMIYSGQEAGLDKRLRFFEKDTISWEDKNNKFPFYQKLNDLKANNAALWNGEYGAMPEKLEDGNQEVFSFIRSKENNTVIGIINMSDKNQKVNFKDSKITGTYIEYFTHKAWSPGDLILAPWQYLIFTTGKTQQ